MPTILLKKSDTASAVPTTANLTNLAGGVEVAVNTADKRMFTMTSASAVVELGTNPSSLTLTGGTANGVLYLNGSKAVTSGSALSFTGSLLKVGNPTNAPNTNLSGNLLQVKSASGFSYLTMGNGDGADNNTYIGSASSITTFGTVTDAGATSELMRLTSTGLGIGTSSPAYPLQVRRAGGAGSLGVSIDSVGSISRAVQYYSVGDATNVTAGHVWYYRPATATDTVGMVLNGDGQVGIGTSSPSTKLHIKDSTGTAVNLLRLETPYSNPSGNKSIIWTDATDTLGRISISYTAAGGSQMSFGSLYNGGYQTSDLMVLNSSGNLGLGVTPSAWQSTRRILQVGGSAALWASSSGAGTLFLSNNTYFDGTNFRYLNTSGASYLAQQTDGSFTFNSAASGTAGNAISFTQAMTLDASGNLGVGTTSPGAKLGLGGSADISMKNIANTSGFDIGLLGGTSDATAFIYQRANAYMAFGTNNTERARITAGGNLLVGTTTDVSGRSGVISDVSGNVRAIPRTGAEKTSDYTLAITDVGQFVQVGTSGSVTVPNNTFATGDVVSVFNNTTGNISLNCPITTAYVGGTNTDRASVTLSTRGVATVLFINPSLCVINGNVS